MKTTTALCLTLVMLAAFPFAAAGQSAGAAPRIAPINSLPGGQSYGRWAVEWFQWAYGVPLATNPLLDATGDQCAQRQVDNVWFLAGTPGPDAAGNAVPVIRDCSVPAGKALFFPMINTGYGAFLNDSPETVTDSYVRAAGRCTQPAQIAVQIDGVDIAQPTSFFTGGSGSRSPLFTIQLPPGNIFDADATAIPELVLTPSAEEGYYLFVHPLAVGSHTIHWTASGCSIVDADGHVNAQDVTYHLDVVSRAR